MKTKVRNYRGQELTVTYEMKRCIHAAECVARLPSVFDVKKRPWVQPDEGSADALAETVMHCPTGALHLINQAGVTIEALPEENTLLVAANGPLYLHGQVKITNAKGELLREDTRLALCRCGASQNKPFCDNSHLKSGFEHDGQLAQSRKDSGQADERGASLTVKLFDNGPLFLQGNFELQSADRQTLFRGSKTALCRCGSSNNKPFCDGMHKQVGFTTN
jgi:CDGSH-type Zn-finger protein/uncharacterized Fe-S cluster protein YjdI